jgi:predicted CopG family antitoxin
MPRAGYKTICVTDEVYFTIKRKAKDTKRSIPEYIVHLIDLEKQNKEQVDFAARSL